MPRNLFQYQGRAEVVSTAPERISPDKWLPDQNEPAAPRRAAHLPVALVAGALFFVPVVQAPVQTPIPDVPQVQPVRAATLPAACRQDAWAGPLLPPPAPPIPDTSASEMGVPRRAHRPQPAYTDGGAFVPLVASQPALTPLPGVSNPERVHRAALTLAALYGHYSVDPTALLSHERVTLDKWWAQPCEPVRDVVRRVHLIPATCELRQTIIRPSEGAITLDKWWQPAALPQWAAKPYHQEYLVGPFLDWTFAGTSVSFSKVSAKADPATEAGKRDSGRYRGGIG